VEEFSTLLGLANLFPVEPIRDSARFYRRWAFESAALDLALRQNGLSLQDAVGRVAKPVTFVVSIRLGEPASLAPLRAMRSMDPSLHFKLDPTASWDDGLLAELASLACVDVVDMKGHYRNRAVAMDPDPDLFRRVFERLPAAWIEDPQEKGSATIAGVDTIRIAGDLDVARLLADVAKLLGASAGDGLLTPKLRAQLVDAVKSAKVELWTGARDRVVRKLTAAIDFTFADDAARPITGLDGGRIDLRLRLDDVNATAFEVAAPKNARPLSELIGDSGLDGLLSGIGKGFGSTAGGGDGGAAFLRCITAARGNSTEVMRCSSKLAP